MNSKDKKIGLPTLGTQVTRFYRESLEELFQSTNPDKTSIKVVETDVDFKLMNSFLPDGFTELMPLLENTFLDLKNRGADIFLIPNITLHAAIDQMVLPKEISQKIIHPITLGIEKLDAENIKMITLIGTRHTMRSSLISSYFEHQGIKVNTPTANDIQILDRIRTKVFESGASKKLIKKMQEVLSHYEHNVLACTELSMLNLLTNSNNNIDLAKLQIEHTVLQI